MNRTESLDLLMNSWKNKEPQIKVYTVKKEEFEIKIDHQNDFFIQDGIVDEQTWDSLPDGKRVLILLKEAYEDNHNNDSWAFRAKRSML